MTWAEIYSTTKLREQHFYYPPSKDFVIREVRFYQKVPLFQNSSS